MRRNRAAALLFLLTVSMHAVLAGNVWLLRGSAQVPGCPTSRFVLWNADAVIQNATDRDQTVRVVEVSNGGEGAGREAIVPAGKARGVQRTFFDFSANSTVWITHLEVPDDLLIDGRLEYLYNDCRLLSQPTDAFGKWPAPVFRELVPPGKRSIHPGVDLGAQNTRLNVGIYNDGTVAATAKVEIFRTACPEQASVAQVISVPSKSLIQTSLFALPPACAGVSTVSNWVAHAVITVDQASLSYAVALSNVEEPRVTVGFAK